MPDVDEAHCITRNYSWKKRWRCRRGSVPDFPKAANDVAENTWTRGFALQDYLRRAAILDLDPRGALCDDSRHGDCGHRRRIPKTLLRATPRISYKCRMIIRACLASDAEGIESLFREFVAYLRSIGDRNDYRFSAQQYLSDGFGSDPAFRGFVAEEGSELIGYVLYSRSYDGEYVRGFYIVDLYVRKDSRGKGVGQRLMKAVRDVSLAEGITRLSWSVHKDNVGALRFYEALGAQYAIDTHVMYLDLT
jgi:GNAT superfamily N-acetyltransferase